MFGPAAVTADVLDIGTRQEEDKRRQMIASGGTGAMCASNFLGEPAAFEVPNVADVSDMVFIYKFQRLISPATIISILFFSSTTHTISFLPPSASTLLPQ